MGLLHLFLVPRRKAWRCTSSDGILWPSDAFEGGLELSVLLQVLGAFRWRQSHALSQRIRVQGHHTTMRRAGGGCAHVGRGPWRRAAEIEAVRADTERKDPGGGGRERQDWRRLGSRGLAPGCVCEELLALEYAVRTLLCCVLGSFFIGDKKETCEFFVDAASEQRLRCSDGFCDLSSENKRSAIPSRFLEVDS